MDDNIIEIKSIADGSEKVIDELLKMPPDGQRDDERLQRLVAFRLNLDGEGPTREYLYRKMQHLSVCGYTGDLYDFLKDARQEETCGLEMPGPPDTVG